MQEKIKMILLISFLSLLTIINIIVGISKFSKTDNTQNNVEENMNIENENKEVIEEQIDIYTMTEGDRIRHYLATYFSYIEKDDYPKAYDLLYPEFKQNYFKTLEEFEKYIEEKYPIYITYNQNSIERQGNYFILNLTILSDSDDKENFSQRFVIYENGINDFVLSFEVI